MYQPPQPPDPNAFTQPIPIVQPPPQQQGQQRTPGVAAQSVPYVHRFGNVPFYMLSRFAAFAFDVFGVAFLIATLGFHAFETGYLAYGSRDEGGFLSLAGISLGIALFIAFLCEALIGTTLGKAMFGLHTRAVDGRHAGGGRVFVRYILRPVDLLLIGPLLALITPRHRHVGDFAGGTVVSRTRFGPLAPIVAILVVLGLGYVQIAYGGGLTSAIEVAAEAANFTPDLIGKAAHGIGFGGLPLPPVSNPTPIPSGPASVVTAAPLASPAAQATDAPATGAPASPDSPSAVETDEPDTQPTSRVIVQ